MLLLLESKEPAPAATGVADWWPSEAMSEGVLESIWEVLLLLEGVSAYERVLEGQQQLPAATGVADWWPSEAPDVW